MSHDFGSRFVEGLYTLELGIVVSILSRYFHATMFFNVVLSVVTRYELWGPSMSFVSLSSV